MEKPKNLHAGSMDMNNGRGDCLRGWGMLRGGGQRGKVRTTVIV